MSTIQGGGFESPPSSPHRRRSVALALACAFAVAGGACERSLDREEEAARVHSVTVTRLGGEVYRVVGGAPSRDGYLIFENRDPAIRHMAWPGGGGRVLDVFGDGPGEFREITSVSVTAEDTIVVFDASSRRISLLSPDGLFVRSIQLTGSESPILGKLRPSAPGWMVMSGSQIRPGEGSGGSFRATDQILQFDRAGTFVGVVTDIPGPEIFFGETGGFLRPLLAKRSAWDVTDGSLVLTDGDTLLVRSTATGEDAMARGVTLFDSPEAIPQSDHSRILDSLGTGLSSPGRSRLRSTYEITSLPDRMPAYGAVVSTRSGSVWIAAYPDPRRENRSWVLYDIAGDRTLKRVELPRATDVLWASEEEMLGVVTDTLGVESVVHVDIGGVR